MIYGRMPGVITKTTTALEADVAKVLCLVFPDGTTLFVPSGEDYRLLLDTWRSGQSADAETTRTFGACGGGLVMMTMLREDYNALPVAEFAWPEASKEVLL